MILIRGAQVYGPEDLGIQDVLVCGGRIEAVGQDLGSRLNGYPDCEVLQGNGKTLVPGFIDQHVHITGGGGENGLASRAPEVMLGALIRGGITTVMGLLGTDGITRNVESLAAKARALKEEGLSVYICTGSYGYPSITLTGSVQKDIVFIDEVLGVKLAISDHRAPNISQNELIRLASDVRTAGMIGKKPGIVVLHMGDDRRGLLDVFAALEATSIPILTFRPTHVNRNPGLWKQALKFAGMGGYIDLTCGISEHMSISEALCEARSAGIRADLITISSDGQGSWSNYDESGRLIAMGVSSVESLYQEYHKLLASGLFSVPEALSCFTAYPARALNLYPAKGCIRPGADADLLLIDGAGSLDFVMAGGVPFMQEGKLVRKGNYEAWQ